MKLVLGVQPGVQLEVLGLSSEVSGLRSQVSGLRSQASCLRFYVSGLRSQVSGPRSLVLGLSSEVLGCLWGVLGTLWVSWEGFKGSTGGLWGMGPAIQKFRVSCNFAGPDSPTYVLDMIYQLSFLIIW